MVTILWFLRLRLFKLFGAVKSASNLVAAQLRDDSRDSEAIPSIHHFSEPAHSNPPHTLPIADSRK